MPFPAELSDTVHNLLNKFPTKNSYEALLGSPTCCSLPSRHPPAPHEEEDGEGHWEASMTGHMLPFPCGQALTALPNHLLPNTMNITSAAPSTCGLAASHRATAAAQAQRGCKQMLLAAGEAIHLWTCNSITATATTKPGTDPSGVNLVQTCCSGCAGDRSEGAQSGATCPQVL